MTVTVASKVFATSAVDLFGFRILPIEVTYQSACERISVPQ